ncbi:hypothetical protein [Demequina iriomotensis]|uniref:hypothetical protein n=1 Tax=Demequina iriomotensis TaxID=1536641 RepID=UPI000A7B58E8|nr:hypothetical protein [Demequina iriomotensis]
MSAASSGAVPAAGGTDISRLLGLHTRYAQLILGVYVVANVVFVASTADLLDHAWASYAAVALVTAGAVVVTRPHPDPFPLRLTWAALCIVVTSSALVLYALPDSGPLGRATWYLGATTWILWFLILRRRRALAWTGGLVMLVETMAWAGASGRGALWGLALASPQILLILIATLFGEGLRRSAWRIHALAQRSLDAAAASGAVEAARRVQDERADELATMVGPSLALIASGASLSEAERDEIVRVDAQLRDSVRGHGLSLPPIVAAAYRARARGVSVTLLDDLGAPLSSAETDAVVGAVSTALDSAAGGSVTVRLLPAGREELLTIVSQAAEEIRRVVLPRGAAAV